MIFLWDVAKDSGWVATWLAIKTGKFGFWAARNFTEDTLSLVYRLAIKEILFPGEDEDWEGEDRPEPTKTTKPEPQEDDVDEPDEPDEPVSGAAGSSGSSGSAGPAPGASLLDNLRALEVLHKRLQPQIMKEGKDFNTKVSRKMWEIRDNISSGDEQKVRNALGTLERLNQLLAAF